MAVSYAGDSRMISASRQSESIEALYRRLYSLQDTIRNLMQDIERMKTQLEGGMNGNHVAGLASQPILSQPGHPCLNPFVACVHTRQRYCPSPSGSQYHPQPANRYCRNPSVSQYRLNLLDSRYRSHQSSSHYCPTLPAHKYCLMQRFPHTLTRHRHLAPFMPPSTSLNTDLRRRNSCRCPAGTLQRLPTGSSPVFTIFRWMRLA